MPYIGQIIVNNEGQQVLQPLYPLENRGFSLPPPIPISNKSSSELINDEDEDKEDMAPTHYYPTCHCHQYYDNTYCNPHGYYYAPASLFFSP